MERFIKITLSNGMVPVCSVVTWEEAPLNDQHKWNV